MRPSSIARRMRGFTLIELMIVVMVIGVLLSIAVPNWMRARESARARTCVSNLTKIEGAKEQCAMESRLGAGYEVAWADIVPGYIQQQPQCPSGGVYEIRPVGTDADCGVEGHDLPPLP